LALLSQVAPGHRYQVAEPEGMNFLRCADCGKEKRIGKFDLPDGGAPTGGAPPGP